MLVDLLPDRWLPRDPLDDRTPKPVALSASSTEHTITGLTPYTLYRIEVRAAYTAPPVTVINILMDQPLKTSDWRHTYTYSTHDPIPSTDGDRVGVIPIVHFRPADPGATHTEVGQYRYVLCNNEYLLPADISNQNRSILFGQVVAAFRTWGDAYDDIDILYNGLKDCTHQEIWPYAKTWVGWGEILGMGVRPRWNR